MAGSFRKLDAAFDTQAQLLGIFDNVVNALPGTGLIEEVVAGNHQRILHIDGTVQSQTARIVAGAGLIDLLTVDQCVRVDDTGGQSANRHHRLID